MAEETVEAEEKDLIEILEPSSGPIDLTRYVDYVRDPAAGAIATFEGTTRDTFEGKRVVELRYEAYVPMATRRLAAVCAEARAAWPVLRVAVAHRLGTVGVGEASVFVAASAVHRAEAMEACRYVIDEVKASVPIWKKEVYENGEVWKENREFLERREAAVGPAQERKKAACCCGSKRHLHVAVGDLCLEILGVLPVDGAADGDALMTRATAMLPLCLMVLVFLRLLEGLDDEGRGGGDDGDLGLPVLGSIANVDIDDLGRIELRRHLGGDFRRREVRVGLFGRRLLRDDISSLL
ncbi:hypothetical protein GW17_00004714 [Ensete ventricosum]|nr:hypothetical protein GW17_00004714 [Ensete ventricosum]